MVPMAPIAPKKRPSARAKTLVARTAWADSPALYARVQPETLAKAKRLADADDRSMASWLDRMIAALPEDGVSPALAALHEGESGRKRREAVAERERVVAVTGLRAVAK